MKEAFTTEYYRRLGLVLDLKLNGRNKITAINTWAVADLRYGAGILKWTQDEVKEFDRKTRKKMTMAGAFNLNSEVDILYIPRNKGGRGLVGSTDCIRSEENGLGWHIKDSKEQFLNGARQVGIIDTENCKIKEEFKQNLKEDKMRVWREKRMHGQFVRYMEKEQHRDRIDKEDT